MLGFRLSCFKLLSERVLLRNSVFLDPDTARKPMKYV